MRGDAETVKERLDIAEVIGEYVKLEKAGQSFKARCPFHNEKTPSFFVSPHRQTYYCFGCGAKGDVFTFVEEIDGLDFREALKTLAERAGVELEYNVGTKLARSEKDKLHEVLEVATQFFEKRLGDNPSAKKYLLSRGLTEETIKEWRIGFAPDLWRVAYSYLLQAGFSKEIVVKAGLAKPVSGNTKEPYDVFRNRLIFPIADIHGQVIAFSGRALDKETEPKYLNSPDTPLFTKSEVLYGLDKAKDKIRRQNYVVLVEGQVDLLLSHQAGVANTVASSGTAFTEAHLVRLKKLSPRIILAFDGDKAGEIAAEKSARLALALYLETKVAVLPEGEDPASVIHGSKGGEEKWKSILRSSKPAIEHFLDKILSEESDSRKVGKLIEKRLLPLLALLESSMERGHFVSLIARRTGIKEEVVWDDLRKVKVAKTESAPEVVESTTRKRLRSEEYQEAKALLKDDPENKDLLRHLAELESLIRIDELDLEIKSLQSKMNKGDKVQMKILELNREKDELKRKLG